MVEELLSDAVKLTSHPFGNFVMQHLWDHGGDDVRSRLTSILLSHMSTFDAKGVAGSVIGKALNLQEATTATQSLAHSVLQDPERLTTMACSRYGHLAVEQALALADEPRRRQACGDLKLRWDMLHSSKRYGRPILTKFVWQ
jgi:hypothetical protein